MVCLAALIYAISFSQLPPADFSFVNGTEVQSIDPAIVTGVPEHRIIESLFNGLYRDQPQTAEPIPAVAERYQLSDDQKTYTFYLRKSCQWSDGTRVTANDFCWSWQRTLYPGTASQYAYQLFYLKNARKYNASYVEVGDLVEVELDDQPPHPSGRPQQFPRGTVLYGKLLDVLRPPQPSSSAGMTVAADWKKTWVYTVEIDGRLRRFSRKKSIYNETCKTLLLDFAQVGVKAIGDDLLEVQLTDPTPFFLHLTTHYALFPVQRTCVEHHGSPGWTKPKNLVCNGPYKLAFRRIRDRIRLVKNPRYWDADQVRLNTVDALAVLSSTTALNMYLDGQVDWITDVPASVVPELKRRKDFIIAPQLTTYFYRLNTTKSPLDQVLVRRALNLAINKQEICRFILRAGQVPARSFVPPGLQGYKRALCGKYDVAEAQRLLTEAGYPGGKGMPVIEILYNTHEAHRTIAERIQSEWKRHLGIDVELRNLEWGVYIDTVHSLDYTVARAGWVGDYADPNTFLDMFITGGENNETGWSSESYDRLITKAGQQRDPMNRLQTLHDAEAILMDHLPIIPIYFSVSKNLVRLQVKGFYANILDRHPLRDLNLKSSE